MKRKKREQCEEDEENEEEMEKEGVDSTLEPYPCLQHSSGKRAWLTGRVMMDAAEGMCRAAKKYKFCYANPDWYKNLEPEEAFTRLAGKGATKSDSVSCVHKLTHFSFVSKNYLSDVQEHTLPSMVFLLHNPTGAHWSLIVLVPADKHILIYDPMEGRNQCFKEDLVLARKALGFFAAEAECRYWGDCSGSWNVAVEGRSYQTGSSDCGVFVLRTMYYLCKSLHTMGRQPYLKKCWAMDQSEGAHVRKWLYERLYGGDWALNESAEDDSMVVGGVVYRRRLDFRGVGGKKEATVPSEESHAMIQARYEKQGSRLRNSLRQRDATVCVCLRCFG